MAYVRPNRLARGGPVDSGGMAWGDGDRVTVEMERSALRRARRTKGSACYFGLRRNRSHHGCSLSSIGWPRQCFSVLGICGGFTKNMPYPTMNRSKPAHARGATSPGAVALTISAASSRDRAMSITLPADKDQPLPCRDCRAYSHARRQILGPFVRPPRGGPNSPACFRISSISFLYLSDIPNPQSEPFHTLVRSGAM